MNHLFNLFLLIGTALHPSLPAPADGVSGTWKRTTMTLTEASGKTSDMLQMMTKSMPCAKDISYTFSNDGHLKTNVPDACGAMKQTIEAMNVEAKWSISGHKLTVTTPSKDYPTAVYDVNFQGNTMTWEFIYANNPQTPNLSKAKKLTMVYQRL